MKFAMRNANTLKLLAMGNNRSWKLAAFFFHDRGSNAQKSLRGMMQEIVHSIVGQYSALWSVVNPIYQNLVRSQKTKVPQWDLVTLKEVLFVIVQQRRIPLDLCLFLDALDEHGGDNELLSRLLKEVVDRTDGEKVQVKMCVASRSWNVFNQHFGRCPNLAVHDHTKSDIRILVESRLSAADPQRTLDPEHFVALVDQVSDKASGVFIWVKLVMDVLAKDVVDGATFPVLLNHILEMPPELKDLYARTLERIELDYCEESYIMLNMALCSASPLPFGTFMLCARHNLGKTYSLDELDEARDFKEEINDIEWELRRLASRSGGLLEVVFIGQYPRGAWTIPGKETPSKWENPCQYYRVQFIHQTVKEYVFNAQKCLGLRGISSTMLQHHGYLYLLAAAVNKDEWAQPLRSELFTSARGYEKTLGPDDSYLPQVRDVLDYIALRYTYDWSSWSDFMIEFQSMMNEILSQPIVPMFHFWELAVLFGLVSYVQNSGLSFLRGGEKMKLTIHVSYN